MKEIISTNKLGGTPRSIHVTDITGDGKDDILATCYKTLTVFSGDLCHIMSKEFQHSLETVYTSDLNGDGSEEIVVGGENKLHILKLGKNWRGKLQLKGILSKKFGDDWRNAVRAISTGDLTRNGRNELVVASGRTLYVFRLKRKNQLEEIAKTNFDSTIWCVLTADVDKDGEIEILGGSRDDTLRVFKLKGNQLIESAKAFVDYWVLSVAVGDLDGDGEPEVVTGSGSRDKRIRVFKLRGGKLRDYPFRKLDLISSIFFESSIWAVCVADIDGDGENELIGGSYDNSLRIFKFKEANLVEVDRAIFRGGVWSIAVGDFDGDGDLEFVAGIGKYEAQMGDRYISDADSLKMFKAERIEKVKVQPKPTPRRDLGEFDETLAAYTDPLQLYKQGQELLINGQYEEALKRFKLSLNISIQQNNIEGVLANLNEIGQTYAGIGEDEEALKFYHKFLQICDKIDSPKIRRKYNIPYGRSIVLNNIANIYLKWGMEERAFEYLKKAYEQAIESKRLDGISSILVNLAKIYQSRGEIDNALQAYRESLEIKEKLGDTYQKGINYLNIGAIYEEKGDYQMALTNYMEAMKIYKEYEHLEGTIHVLMHLGDLSVLQKKLNESLDYYQKALELSELTGRMTLGQLLLGRLAGVYQLKGDHQKSFELLNQAIDISEVLTGKITSELIRESYRAGEVRFYLQMTKLLIDWYSYDRERSHLLESLKFLELCKAREIIDRLETHRITLSVCPEYTKILEKEAKLTKEISRIQMKLIKTTDDKFRKQCFKEIMKRGEELKKTRMNLMEKCPDPGLIRSTKEYNPIPKFKEIFEIENDAVVWEMILEPNVHSDKYKVIVWTSEMIECFESNNFDLKEVLSYYALFIDLIHEASQEETVSGFREKLSLAERALMKVGYILGETIPTELLETLRGRSNLILIPHEKLHILPWEVARIPHPSKFLGLHIPIGRNYSLSLTQSCIEREEPSRARILLVSNPNYDSSKAICKGDVKFDANICSTCPLQVSCLPAAEQEVNSIMELLGEEATMWFWLLRHEQATQENFLRYTEWGFDIIHFAGHGFFDAVDPWMSSLRFYSPEGFDQLTVTKLVQSRLPRTPLFVLSACETGVAKIRRGDEAVGLIRGLTLSGVTSIIATNWTLLDEVAAIFMKEFYRHYFGGKDCVRSLFEARRTVYKKFKSPIAWGVYTLYGNPFKSIR